MTDYIQTGKIWIAKVLYDLVEQDILPGTGIEASHFWLSLEKVISELTPINQRLLEKRNELQKQIDKWHIEHRDQSFNLNEYKSFLKRIGYIVPEVDDFKITTDNVDLEISTVPGPQLVVPVNNARYAINAANARWGSLYDALYGTDVIPEDERTKKTSQYNPARGQKVIDFAMAFLDDAVPLKQGSHAHALRYHISGNQLIITLSDNITTTLRKTDKFSGYLGPFESPDHILFNNNGLYIDLNIDRKNTIGKQHPAGIKDIELESAITTILDFEDSVAAVDAEDKTLVYRNLLGLLQGTLETEVRKADKVFTRTLNTDREYSSLDHQSFNLPGRSLLLVRNVGHLMTTNAVLDDHGNETPEGIIDGMITALTCIHDLKSSGTWRNSRSGSIYIVKPKMHGPEEITFSCLLFERIEEALGLDKLTLKIGIMDEERRTSLNLKACIKEASERVVFINTGFLDRTGDEIHTSMEAGAMVPKGEMKNSSWIKAYENNNIDIGLACGFKGKAQIGKGMWAMPDSMHQMLKSKIEHPLSGANTAWVPSPTAATLHALHYHSVNITQRQNELADRQPANVDDMLVIPLLGDRALTDEQIQQELDNNCQSILGYVVRWINQGIGCSTVPDINNTGLMEDRATLRISSQHLANWLHHGIISENQVIETLKHMAAIVDKQNSADSNYINMAPSYTGTAFKAASELIFRGREIVNGYTEPTLHKWRKILKGSE